MRVCDFCSSTSDLIEKPTGVMRCGRHRQLDVHAGGPAHLPRHEHTPDCQGDCLADRADIVFTLHRPEDDVCAECHKPWPCATVRALTVGHRRLDERN